MYQGIISYSILSSEFSADVTSLFNTGYRDLLSSLYLCPLYFFFSICYSNRYQIATGAVAPYVSGVGVSYYINGEITFLGHTARESSFSNRE